MKVEKLTPNFSVSSINETVKFYQDVLGFSLIMAVPESQDGIEDTIAANKQYVYALVAKDGIELMFQRSDTFHHDVTLVDQKSIGATVSFYMEVSGVDDFYNRIKKHQVTITEIKNAWYGMREFYLRDINGYVIGIAEKV
ncbi:VOC family protein [Pseudochryseolinea flava]|uniref:Bleomycin resistance family protein n=1 Tax=Pseudochryseolinea flava TaxID=2059302 RepID=A0A364Y7J1_9BACT|nr:VOC family protein [Pseudochryseolinea flava]RAW02231.1 bleomycin resistance family protein [Pseudochryseolinea flava]